jgi:hypothetical protein
MTKKIKKILTLNFGIGMTTCKKIHKQLGLNFRNSPPFIEKKHKNYIEKKFIKNKTGKILKKQIENFKIFKKKLKLYTNKK